METFPYQKVFAERMERTLDIIPSELPPYLLTHQSSCRRPYTVSLQAMLSTEAGHRRSYPPPESYFYHLCIFPCLIFVSVQTI